MRRPGSRLIGSVGYFPERYGDVLIEMALNLLEKKYVPPAVFVEHKLVTPQDLSRLYPNDSFISPAEMDSLILQYAAHG
jgi:ribose transport system substrate-binding protein